jgi:carbon-monoxide dehydrogenase medium subunit
VKPSPFTYHRPRSREEVDGLLASFGGDAKILAGGQSLVPLLNMRLATPSHVIDINRLENEPAEPSVDGGALMFGPLVRHASAERSAIVAEQLSMLGEALSFVGHPAIRSRGTVVGSIAHADPAAEIPAVLVLLEGEVGVRSAEGHRTVPAPDFFMGPFQPALEETEWVEEVGFPLPPPDAGFAFNEFARRSGDYALCGVAAMARPGDGGVRIVLSYLGMGPAPVRVELPAMSAEHLADGVVDEAVADTIRDRVNPLDDLHASREYRMWLARRLGAQAARRATGGLEDGR